MYYLIQQNIFTDQNYSKLAETLDRLQLPYEVVALKPFSEELEVTTQRTDIFVYGSVKLARIARNYAWNPGSFYGGNHAFEAYAQGYGEHLLNHDSTLHAFAEPLDWQPGERKFIRPAKDAKVFTGKEFTQMKWEDLVAHTLAGPADTRLNAATEIQISTPKTLLKEARTWIVGGKVITSCYYRFHGTADFEADVSPEGLAFAQRMAELYCVADAFVMDICATPEGWKIVEVNCINSAGFYNCNVPKLVAALEEMVGWQRLQVI